MIFVFQNIVKFAQTIKNILNVKVRNLNNQPDFDSPKNTKKKKNKKSFKIHLIEWEEELYSRRINRLKRSKCQNYCEKNKHGNRSEWTYDKYYLWCGACDQNENNFKEIYSSSKASCCLMTTTIYGRVQSTTKKNVQHHKNLHLFTFVVIFCYVFIMVLRLAAFTIYRTVYETCKLKLIGEYKRVLFMKLSNVWELWMSVGYDVN